MRGVYLRCISSVLSLIMLLTVCFGFDSVAYGAVRSDSKAAQGKVIDKSNRPIVYSLDVAWGAMKFIYEINGTRIWDEGTHEYTEEFDSEWKATGNFVQVTNHSNTSVTATMGYEKAEDHTHIEGEFSQGTMKLPSAVGYAKTAKEIVGVSTLTLKGELDIELDEFQRVGTVKVSIE